MNTPSDCQSKKFLSAAKTGFPLSYFGLTKAFRQKQQNETVLYFKKVII